MKFSDYLGRQRVEKAKEMCIRDSFGWVGEDSERITGDDAWREGVYYCGNSDDGAQVLNAWSLQEVDDPDTEEDNFDGTYWFYFGTNGKKIKDTTKTINGLKYRFNENGAAESEWYAKASTTTASGSNLYYNLPEQCWLAKGWFKTIPGAEVDPCLLYTSLRHQECLI